MALRSFDVSFESRPGLYDDVSPPLCTSCLGYIKNI